MEPSKIFTNVKSKHENRIKKKTKVLNDSSDEKNYILEKEKHNRLIGQLKAAEARNRNKILRMKYFNSKQDEIDHIIDSQTTALKAIRLEAFLPPVRKERIEINDNLNKVEKRRLESILDDNMNSLFERRLN